MTENILRRVFVEVNYTITIKTGPLTTAGINGAVYIKIFGRDNKQTEEILLTKSSADQSFLPDSEREFQIQANDIGKPRRIIIRHEDPTNGWYLDYVNILVHDSLFRSGMIGDLRRRSYLSLGHLDSQPIDGCTNRKTIGNDQ